MCVRIFVRISASATPQTKPCARRSASTSEVKGLSFPCRNLRSTAVMVFKKPSPPSNCQQMAGAFARGAAALVVDLGGGDVAVAEQFLHLADMDAGFE